MRSTRTLTLAALFAAGCAADDAERTLPIADAPSGPVLEQSQLPIFGGSAPDQPFHDAVVALHQVSGGSVYPQPFCSGTLISPSVVLTAAHCLDVSKGGKPKFSTMAPDALAIYVGPGVALDPAPTAYPVAETSIYAGYNKNSNAGDIALVRLAVSLDGATVPALPAALAVTPADIGTPLNFAGFGRTEDGSLGVKLQADTPLGGLGCSVAGCPSPGDAQTMISYSQPTAGPCNGDSGGPAFLFRDGAPYVAGVTSYGDAGCTVYGVSTKVDAFQAYIDGFVGDGGAGGAGGEGGTGGAGGEGGTGGGADACGDGICDAGESCDGRSGTAVCPSDCDGVTNGKPSRRYCMVGGTCEGPGCP